MVHLINPAKCTDVRFVLTSFGLPALVHLSFSFAKMLQVEKMGTVIQGVCECVFLSVSPGHVGNTQESSLPSALTVLHDCAVSRDHGPVRMSVGLQHLCVVLIVQFRGVGHKQPGRPNVPCMYLMCHVCWCLQLGKNLTKILELAKVLYWKFSLPRTRRSK